MPRHSVTRPVSPERLRAISEHVLYEIEMFAHVTDLLTPHLWRDVPVFMADGAQNAFIESFTIHVRALHDFLFAEPRGDDVSAADWFAGKEAEWERVRGPEPEVLRGARVRTGKEIAHVTYARLERGGDGKLWPHCEIVEALRTPLFRFIDRVDRRLVCENFFTHAWMAIQTAASEPHRARVGEPGAAHETRAQPFGMPVATQSFRPAPREP